MQWRPIQEFDRYSISDEGLVRNDHTGRIMALRRNQQGIVMVGLVRGGKQYMRSVTRLVAETYLPEPKLSQFDSIIHLDGDSSNNNVYNLMWRPRWFATKYHRQFDNPDRGYDKPIEEMYSHTIFPNVWDAAIEFGLLVSDVTISLYTGKEVWPTYQIFLTVEE